MRYSCSLQLKGRKMAKEKLQSFSFVSAGIVAGHSVFRNYTPCLFLAQDLGALLLWSSPTSRKWFSIMPESRSQTGKLSCCFMQLACREWPFPFQAIFSSSFTHSFPSLLSSPSSTTYYIGLHCLCFVAGTHWKQADFPGSVPWVFDLPHIPFHRLSSLILIMLPQMNVQLATMLWDSFLTDYPCAAEHRDTDCIIMQWGILTWLYGHRRIPGCAAI